MLQKHINRKFIDKNQVNDLKNNPKALLSFLQNQGDSTIIYVLERLGKLKNGYSKKPLLSLLKSDNETVRALVAKNLAKIGDISLLDTFAHFSRWDTSTEVRREFVSAIGRLRSEKAIPILIQSLSDKDPKVVMQAIRGLFIFSDHNQVKKELSKLLKHPNELIKEIIDQKVKKVNKARYSSKDSYNQSPVCLRNTIVQGDVIEILRYVPNESVHLTFTSPPYYNARDYSIYQSYNEYLSFLEVVFKEVHRITKEGRFFVLNTSPVIIPRISRAHASKRYPIPYDIHPLLVKMGWEFIDDIVWLKPEASVKNRNAGFLQHRKPLGYKPNAVSEMLMVYRKKTDKLIDWNMRQYSFEKVQKSKVLDKYETTNIWRIDPTFNKIHSAVFPLELCNRVIKYYSYVDDLIFDPFAGSGTLGRAAVNLERYFFLTEKETKYINSIKERLTRNAHFLDKKNIKTKFISLQDLIGLIKK